MLVITSQQGDVNERNFVQCTYATTYLHMETVFPKRCYVGEQIIDIAENKFSFRHRQNFFGRFCGLETLQSKFLGQYLNYYRNNINNTKFNITKLNGYSKLEITNNDNNSYNLFTNIEDYSVNLTSSL